MTLRLDPTRIVAAEFGCLEPAQPEWLDQHAYWEDFNARFFRSNGRPYDSARDSNVTGWLGAPDRAPYAAMADRLLDDLSARVDASDVDLVLLAHWLPDLHLGTSVTNFVQNRLAIEDGLGFAISDRGPSAGLFALDLAARYLRNGRRRALVLAMDQKHLLYRSAALDRLAPVNSATALLLESVPERGEGGLDEGGLSEGGQMVGGLAYAGYSRSIGQSPADLPRQLAHLCAAAGLARQEVTVIAAPELAALAAAEGPVKATAPGWLCAGPLAALAQHAETRDATTRGATKRGASQPGHALLATYEAGELVTVLLRDMACPPAEGQR